MGKLWVATFVLVLIVTGGCHSRKPLVVGSDAFAAQAEQDCRQDREPGCRVAIRLLMAHGDQGEGRLCENLRVNAHARTRH